MGPVLGGTAATVAGGQLHVYARKLDADGRANVFGASSADGSTFERAPTPLATEGISGAPGLATDGTRIWMAVRSAGNHLDWTVRDAGGDWLRLRRLTSAPVAGDTSPSLHRDGDGLLTVYSRGAADVIQQHSHDRL
jgi:hypothetical protein